MNHFALHLANGNLFFVGQVMTLAGFAFFLSPCHNYILRSVVRIACITGIGLVAASSTPISIWLYGIWFGLCTILAVIITVSGAHAKFACYKSFAFVAMTAISLSMCVVELPYHCPPSIEISSDIPVYVLGDSISAGVRVGTRTGERTWPDVLGDISYLKVINLAQPGATVESALKEQVPDVKGNALVIVEIGGNDLLNFADAHVFQARLDQLLGLVSGHGNQVVMFELPLIPFQNGIGQAQRSLSKKYGVKLIPKYFMTNVFGLRDGTLDGLHLSQTGHNAMAQAVFKLLNVKMQN